MKCKVCDTPLTDEEATAKVPGTNDFLDECLTCQGNMLNDVDELTDESYEDFS